MYTIDLVTNKFKTIISHLGEPYFSRDDFLLFNMDCVDAMELLPKGLIDLTVTSPPYNIGKEYESSLKLSSYISWSEKWIDLVHKVTKDNGTFWLNLGYYSVKEKGKAVPIIYTLWDKIPFFLIQEVIWHYTAGVAGRKFLSPRNEKFLWYVKDESDYVFNLDDIRDPNVKYPNQKKNGKLKCNPLGKNPGDVWIFPKVTSGRNRSSKERTSHPAQFPESVIERVIKASSNKDDLILDPFMGSGTTAIVAHKLGRKTIGFEISLDYCEITKERYLLAQKKQLPLIKTT
jgi:adenine-specific DNA-methyltransferase